MILLFVTVLVVWLVLVGYKLLQLRGWIEAARADIDVQLAHQDRLAQQAANAADRETAERVLARLDEAVAGARRYHHALVAEYNRRLAIPPGPLVGRLARLAPVISETAGSDTELEKGVLR